MAKWGIPEGRSFRHERIGGMDMDLNPILHAAIQATGGDINSDEFCDVDLERARNALLLVAKKLDEALGYTEVASFSMTLKGQPHD